MIKAKAVVPEEGPGIFHAIVGIDQPDPAVPSGFRLVVADVHPAFPHRQHWDGERAVLGPWIPAEELERDESVQETRNKVDATLADYIDKLSAFLLNRFTVLPEEFAFIDAASNLADVKAALSGILSKLALTPDQIDFLEDFRTKYAALIAAME